MPVAKLVLVLNKKSFQGYK